MAKRLYSPLKMADRAGRMTSGFPVPSSTAGGSAVKSFSSLWTNKSTAGAVVTPLSALQSSAFLVCVKLISQTCGYLPLKVFSKQEDGHWAPAVDHPLYRLMLKPNFWQTPLQFRCTLTMHVCLRGNGYAFIDRDESGSPVQLIPVIPDYVQPMLDDSYQMWYRISFERHDAVYNIPARDMLHLKWCSYDSYVGLSPISLQAEVIGKALTTQEHVNRFYSNGASYGAVLTHPATLSDTARANIRRDMESSYSGSRNAFKTLILEEGMTVNKTSMSMQDQQFIEHQNFTASEIASVFGIPAHMLNIPNRMPNTGSGLEQISMSFLRDTMGPWFKAWTETVESSLFTEDEYFGEDLKIEFDTSDYLKTDEASRYRIYTSGRSIGTLSKNDIRLRENMPRISTPDGDDYSAPLNSNASDAGAAQGGDPTMNDDKSSQAVHDTQSHLDQVGAGQKRGEK